MTESQEPRHRVSRDDVESVSRKLADLARELPESERAVLGLVLSRAAAAPADLDPAEQGRLAAAKPKGAFEQPFAGQLARAAGLFDGPQVTVVVGWQYRFGIDDIGEQVIDPAEGEG